MTDFTANDTDVVMDELRIGDSKKVANGSADETLKNTLEVFIADRKVEIYDEGGSGFPLFLVHGNSSSFLAFSKLFNSELQDYYRIIAINLPGHGASELLSENEAFSIESLGHWLARIINSFEFEQYALLGQSLGGHCALEALEAFTDLKHLILVSSPPVNLDTLGTAFKPDPSGGLLFKGELSPQEAENLADCFSTNFDALTKQQLNDDILNTHVEFRSLLGASLANGLMIDECEQISQSNINCTLFYGSEDQFLDTTYMDNLSHSKALKNLNCIKYEDHGHCLIQENSNKFIQDLIALLQQTNPSS